MIIFDQNLVVEVYITWMGGIYMYVFKEHCWALSLTKKILEARLIHCHRRNIA